ncbi:unnamed protein product [Linum trigynum]
MQGQALTPQASLKIRFGLPEVAHRRRAASIRESHRHRRPRDPMEFWSSPFEVPPGFTPHPFPTDPSSPNPRSVSGPSCQQLQHPHPEANYMLYGALPSSSPHFDKDCHFPNNIARNLSAEMEVEAWAHAYAQQPNLAYQANYSQAHNQPFQAHISNAACSTNHLQPNLAQVMLELNRKMDLNKKPLEDCPNQQPHNLEEGQAEWKKRKHGNALDFEGPYFALGEGSIKPKNARIKVKPRKNQTNPGLWEW